MLIRIRRKIVSQSMREKNIPKGKGKNDQSLNLAMNNIIIDIDIGR